MPKDLKLLPMFGHTRGNRSAATCHFKCGTGDLDHRLLLRLPGDHAPVTTPR
ncbi:hypothetical protein ACPCG0_08260 [Propionibacteriaceae bacterium Y1923]|uniref:hypothetical protein n=1 Tax=Aestuariimicrobium sp. Y1814 TaxID=3418742 RepID=UPI003C228A97